MKLILITLTLFSSLRLWAQCPVSRYTFPVRPASFSKILLIPGAGSEDDDLYLGHVRYGKYFEAYTTELSRKNIPHVVVNSSSTGNESVEVRVSKLLRYIAHEDRPVLLIGHSMGGLVARLALRNSAAAKKVAATVTISTPHEGTPVADWLLKEGVYSQASIMLAKAFGFDVADKKYLSELTVSQKYKWNTPLDHQNHINNLFSVVAGQTPKELLTSNPLFALGDTILRQSVSTQNEILSDGLVPIDSQTWGNCLFVKGNHGSVIGVDVFMPSSIDVLSTIFKSLGRKGIVYQ